MGETGLTLKRLAAGACALGALSGLACSSAAEEKPTIKPTTMTPVAPKEATPATPPVADGQHGLDLAALGKNADWVSFKEFWRQLDRLPSLGLPGGQSGSPTLSEYQAQVDALKRVVDRGLLEAVHAQVLTELARERSSYLSGRCQGLMTMHRLPMPEETASCDRSAKLESRIDTLIALRKDGKIGDAAFDSAMLGAIEQIELAALIQLLGLHSMAPALAFSKEDNAAELISSLRDRLSEAPADNSIDQQAELGRIEEILPAIRLLAADLEQ